MPVPRARTASSPKAPVRAENAPADSETIVAPHPVPDAMPHEISAVAVRCDTTPSARARYRDPSPGLFGKAAMPRYAASGEGTSRPFADTAPAHSAALRSASGPSGSLLPAHRNAPDSASAATPHHGGPTQRPLSSPPRTARAAAHP